MTYRVLKKDQCEIKGERYIGMVMENCESHGKMLGTFFSVENE